MFVEGKGFTYPEDKTITKWVDLRANITVDKRNHLFSILGSGFSEFQNKEYYTLFTTRKTNNDKYYLIKTLYTPTYHSVKEQSVIIYKIINYDLSTLTFQMRGYTNTHGEIKGELVFTPQKEGYHI